MSTNSDFVAEFRAALFGDPSAPILDYGEHQVFTRGEIADIGRRIVALLEEAGVPRDAAVGLVIRNRPLQAAAMLGLIAGGYSYTSIYAFQSPAMLARDVAETRFAAVVADAEDWSPALRAAVEALGALGVCLDLGAKSRVAPVPSAARCRLAGDYHRVADGAIEILSSGTTGKPKRIVFPTHMLVRAVETVKAGQMDDSRPPDICTWPLAGIGGLCNLVANIVIQRYMTLMDRFNVAEWVAAVRRHRPSFCSGPPTVAQMVVDAGVAPEDLASVKYFYGGSAPMPEALETTLLEKYGIRTVWGYGATEFCGTVISWSAALYEQFYPQKRGAMGRALPGIGVRVVDPDTGAVLPDGAVGYLEARVPAIGEHWIRTTDLARIDDDGFVFHQGRGDGAILRGGFKILPETLVNALRQHPAVLDAAVVGMADDRLGQVPVAAIELRAGALAPREDELLSFLRERLAANALPAHLRIVEALPRTPSLKADLAAVRALFA